MNFIFLDMDGPMNDDWCMIQWSKNLNEHTKSWEVDPKCVAILQHIIENTEDTYIVFSTTWRITDSLEELYQHLCRAGYTLPYDTIAGATPSSSEGFRGAEIDVWLKIYGDYPNCKWVSIDDEMDVFPCQRKNLVHVHPGSGLIYSHAEVIMEYFNDPSRSFPDDISWCRSRVEESRLVPYKPRQPTSRFWYRERLAVRPGFSALNSSEGDREENLE